MGFIINPYFFAAGTPFTNTYSVDFDGVNDYVGTGATISTLGITDKFTFSFWIKLDSIANYDGVLGAVSNSSFGDGFGCYISTTGNVLKCFINNYSSGGLVESGTLITGTWYHFLWCYDGTLGSNNIELFIDGSSVDTAAFTATVTSSTNIFDIGRVSPTSSGGGAYYAFNGNLDEVALWNTDQRADVATIYNSGIPTDLSSLSPVAWWRMGDGDTYPMLNNEQAYSNRSVDFDGVDDYVVLGTPTDYGLGSTNVFSISFWFLETATTLSSYDHLMSNATSSGMADGFGIYYKSPYIYFWVNDDTNYHRSTFDATIRSKWSHICAVYDGTLGSANIKIYVNNVLAASSAFADETANLSGTSTNIYIGRVGAASSWYAPGKYDDVSIFSSALSASDVTDIYNSGAPKDETSASGLVGYYLMGDGDTYPTLTDNAGSNDGTMTNMVAGDITGAQTTGIMTNMVSGDIVEDVPS